MNYLITILVGTLALVGSWFINPPNSNYDGLKPSEELTLGATSFPASLDALTNPVGTDSVATVSHSGQHSNANDAIEVIEAKIGTGASTPVSGTVMVGDGTGTSRWSTFATTTSLYSTNILATASSTLQDFTFANATGTKATTTSLFSTTASSTNFYSTGLTPCIGSNAVQWTGGQFSCGAISSNLTTLSTTTSVTMSTTTITSAFIPTTNELEFMMYASSTGIGAERSLTMCFNNDCAGAGANLYSTISTSNGGASTVTNSDDYIKLTVGTGNFLLHLKINNTAGFFKTGTFLLSAMSTTSVSVSNIVTGSIFWRNTSQITQIDISHQNDPTNNYSIGNNSLIRITGY